MLRIVSCGFLVSVQDPSAVKAMYAVNARVLDQSIVTFGFSTIEKADFPSEHFKVYKMHPTIWPESHCWLGWRMLVRGSSCSEAKA